MDAYFRFLTGEFALGPVTVQNWMVIAIAVITLSILGLKKG